MIHFPEEGFPSKKDNRHSERCSWLWNHGLEELRVYADKVGYSGNDYVGDRAFKQKGGTDVKRKLKWTHVSTSAKAHARNNAAPGHYLLHSPQQMVGQYHGLIKAGFLAAGDGFHFSLQAKVRWDGSKDRVGSKVAEVGDDVDSPVSQASSISDCSENSDVSDCSEYTSSEEEEDDGRTNSFARVYELDDIPEEEDDDRRASSSARVSEVVQDPWRVCSVFCYAPPPGHS